jgi:hypothetical protein
MADRWTGRLLPVSTEFAASIDNGLGQVSHARTFSVRMMTTWTSDPTVVATR